MKPHINVARKSWLWAALLRTLLRYIRLLMTLLRGIKLLTDLLLLSDLTLKILVMFRNVKHIYRVGARWADPAKWQGNCRKNCEGYGKIIIF